MIAGRPVTPLRPIQRQPGESYNHTRPVFSTRPSPAPPSVTGNQPRPVFPGGRSDPRPVIAPSWSAGGFTPAPVPR